MFVRLLFPLAVQHRVPREDMVRRLLVFSDMQFDAAERAKKGLGLWATNHDVIALTYEEAGYDVPKIVYLNSTGELETAPVEAERKGVAPISGFSPAMMKVFIMGEEVGKTLEDDTVVVDKKGEDIKPPQKPKTTLLSIMKRALEKPNYDGFVLVSY